MVNLRRHLDNLREVYGIPCLVAINRFPTDTDGEVAKVVELVEAAGVNAFPATHFADGGVGAQDLAKGVLQALDEPSPYCVLVHLRRRAVPTRKVEAIATRVYGARLVTWDAKASTAAAAFRAGRVRRAAGVRGEDAELVLNGPTLRGAPTDHELHVREVRFVSGSGLRRRGVRRHDDHARTAQGPVRVPDRPGGRRDDPRPVLSGCRLVDAARSSRVSVDLVESVADPLVGGPRSVTGRPRAQAHVCEAPCVGPVLDHRDQARPMPCPS